MLNIALDGHVGSGKSTIAKGIANQLGLKVLDTGAIYRGLACCYKEKGLPVPNENIIEKFVSDIKVEVVFIDDLQHVVVNGKDYTQFLRLEETSMMAAQISPFSVLRSVVLKIQRQFAKDYPCVIEGRDIGREVLPDAQVKFFVTASEEVRAKRRFDQIKDKDSTSFQDVLKDLRERDYNRIDSRF